MILFVHMMFGAAMGALADNFLLGIFLAFLSHYFLDLLPHNEYPIGTNERNQFTVNFLNISKVFIDFSLGVIFIFIFYKAETLAGQLFIYIYAMVATIPDGLALLNEVAPIKLLKKHEEFHTKKIHFLKYKKIPTFLRILSQVSVFILAIILLKI